MIESWFSDEDKVRTMVGLVGDKKEINKEEEVRAFIAHTLLVILYNLVVDESVSMVCKGVWLKIHRCMASS